MKSGYYTIMWNKTDHGASKINHHQPHQSLVFIQRKCDVVSMVGLEGSSLSIKSFFQKTK